MPSRMIRDGLLESEAVLSLPAEARWLYVSILLSADDLGLFEATPFRLARKADVRRELADKLLQMLVDCDLVRLYVVDDKAYGFIPRFGQRLQIKRAKHPLPPIALLSGDQEALNKINNLTTNPTVDHGGSPLVTAGQRSEPEPEPEEEEKKKTRNTRTEAPRRSSASLCLSDLELLGVERQHAADWIATRKAKRLPLTQTALDGVIAEAQKAGITLAQAVAIAAAQGWGGFRAEWQQGAAQKKPVLANRQEALEAQNRAVSERWVANMQAQSKAAKEVQA